MQSAVKALAGALRRSSNHAGFRKVQIKYSLSFLQTVEMSVSFFQVLLVDWENIRISIDGFLQMMEKLTVMMILSQFIKKPMKLFLLRKW